MFDVVPTEVLGAGTGALFAGAADAGAAAWHFIFAIISARILFCSSVSPCGVLPKLAYASGSGLRGTNFGTAGLASSFFFWFKFGHFHFLKPLYNS